MERSDQILGAAFCEPVRHYKIATEAAQDEKLQAREAKAAKADCLPLPTRRDSGAAAGTLFLPQGPRYRVDHRLFLIPPYLFDAGLSWDLNACC
jgi:hypothetical protein